MSINLRQFRMPRRESPCSPFPVDYKFHLFTIDFMLFDLCNIMGNIINQCHSKFLGGYIEHLQKCFSCPVHNTLPVCPGIIGCSPHCSKIILRLRTFIWCTGKFFIRQFYLIFTYSPFHDFKKISADLMTKSTRACMDHYSNLIFKKPETVCSPLIINLINILHFKKMITRAKRALLCPSHLVCRLLLEKTKDESHVCWWSR